MSDALSTRNALVAALDQIELTQVEHSCGEECWEGTVPRNPAYLADELIDLLAASGWSLVQVDPFAAAGPPSECCGGWMGPDGQRSMRCPVVTDMFAAGPSDEELAERLDAFQEAAEVNGSVQTKGTAGEQRRSRERLHNTRIALVQLIRGSAVTGTSAPAIGGADTEPPNLTERLEHVEAIVLGRDGPSVLDTLAERLTALEDRLDTWVPQGQA